MVGVEFDHSIAEFRKQLVFKERVFTGSSVDPNVLRLLPPLTINTDPGRSISGKNEVRICDRLAIKRRDTGPWPKCNSSIFDAFGFVTCTDYPDLTEDDRYVQRFLQSKNIQVDAGIWTDEEIDWSDYDVVILRSTWDYFYNPIEFSVA